VSGWLARVLAGGLLVASSACFEDPTGRFEAQRELGVMTVPETETVARLEPGARPLLESAGRLRFRASGPTPELVLSHAGPDVFRARLTVENVFEDASLQPTLGRLTGVRGCADEGAGQAIVLAPFESEVVAPRTLAVEVAVPSCAQLVLRAVPPDARGELGGGELRFAVVGETKGDLAVLGAIGARIAALRATGGWSAHFLVALGNLANSPEQPELTAWRDVAERAGVPLVVALGGDEVGAGGLLPFHRVFGRSDYSFAVGDVRFFVLDTASAGVSEAQLAFWRREMGGAREPVRVALMQRPPFDPSGGRDAGFTSRLQAARLVALLGEHGVDIVFTGGVGTYERFEMGNIPFHATGGGGGPIEAFSDVDAHFLRVTVSPTGAVSVEVEAVD
jgi:hypothetical protein